MPNSLVHISDFQAALSIEDDQQIDLLDRTLDAAAAWVQDHCGRTFGLQTAQTREFWPRTATRVDVVDLVSVTSLKTDSTGDRSFATEIPSTGYVLMPLGQSRYQRIEIWPTSSRSFAPGRLVQVIGTFGYVEAGQVPAAVKQATIILASRLFHRKDAPFGILGATELGQFERLSKDDYDVLNLLAPYRLRDSWVAV